MSMSTNILTFNTEHEGMMNDSQFDYYGTRLATCDATGLVKICKMENDQVIEQSITQFQAHQGPCWQLSWAHPKFESVIATCGYDRNIRIWKETKINQWECVYSFEADSSVNTLQWCPWEYGLHLAAGSADGRVHLLSRVEGDQWQQRAMNAHDGAITGLSWGPATEPCLLLAENFEYMTGADSQSVSLVPKRLVTGGMDHKVKIWQENANSSKFEIIAELGQPTAHDDWVRDVAWCSNVGSACDIIATCGEDQKLKIWKHEQNGKGGSDAWINVFSHAFQSPVWKCAWSPVGFMLAVSCGDNQTKVFRETNQQKGHWEIVSEVSDEGQIVDSADAAAQN